LSTTPVNNTGQPYTHYSVHATDSVINLYKRGIPILVGSDANLSPYVPANPPFGLSLHEELELLVAAGVSPVDAIRGATALAASTCRLYDRGSIATGLRADLVLLSADPTVHIRNSRSIKKVWINGIENDPSS
jgi:imidazolonepropionase-like amidohydrolase